MNLYRHYVVVLAALALQGCIAGTVVEIAAETIEAGVEITGAAVGGIVDVVTPDDEDEEGSGPRSK
jgi:hypothetical protein